LSPSRRRACIDHVRSQFPVSERRACRVLGQHGSTQRRLPVCRADGDRRVADRIELTRLYGRYGYRRIAALLRDAGWQVNDHRVERLWRREGLKAPMKQPKKGRLWLDDGSCVRLRPECRNPVWLYDFVHHRTDDGKAFRTLNILDEYSRECLTIRVKRRLNSNEVIDALTDLFILRGVPAYIRSDNGCHRPRSLCSGRPRLDDSGRSQDRLHRTGITLGKGILREFQREYPRLCV
jgi:transposase InsO family protein